MACYLQEQPPGAEHTLLHISDRKNVPFGDKGLSVGLEQLRVRRDGNCESPISRKSMESVTLIMAGQEFLVFKCCVKESSVRLLNGLCWDTSARLLMVYL